MAGSSLQALSGTNDCGMVGRLQARLQGDANALNALRTVPGAGRSVANAIQFWAGAWTPAAPLGGDKVIAPIQAAVIQTIQAAPRTCQEQQVRGPRLIAVSDGSGTTIVSLGSGVWAWKELLQTTSPGDDK